MPINVTWGNAEQTYTIFKFTGKWTWEEYHQAVSAGYEMVKDKPYTVNILIDIMDSNLFPSNMLSKFGSSMQRPPKDFDLAIVATRSGFAQSIARILDTLYGKHTRFKVVKTLEEAHALLAEHDAKQKVTIR
jgi:hypothetical protein